MYLRLKRIIRRVISSQQVRPDPPCNLSNQVSRAFRKTKDQKRLRLHLERSLGMELLVGPRTHSLEQQFV